MKYIKLDIPDLWLMEPEIRDASTGIFVETFRDNEFRMHVSSADFVQDLNVRFTRGTLMGLRYQPMNPQGKLVRVVTGKVVYVAVDLRKASQFFGNWVKVDLSESNKRMLWIPPGFADGCYVISPDAELAFKQTAYRLTEEEISIQWNDPVLDIQWDLLPGIPGIPSLPPILSEKDRQAIPFGQVFCLA